MDPASPHLVHTPEHTYFGRHGLRARSLTEAGWSQTLASLKFLADSHCSMQSIFTGATLGALLIVAGGGCLQPKPRLQPLGPLQVSRSGRTCSCLTAVFGGPMTARGRNEGYVKSSLEVWGLIPFVRLIPRYSCAADAAHGQGREQYLQTLRHPLNVNAYPDSIETLRASEIRGIASASLTNRLRRYLCQCNFLNTTVLLAALRAGAINRDEARELFFHWIAYVADYRHLNLPILNGNRHMISRLHAAAVLNEGEACYFLKQWLIHLERVDFSILEDLEQLHAVSEKELEPFIERERLALLANALQTKNSEVCWDNGPGLLSERRTRNAMEVCRAQRRLLKGLRKPLTLPRRIQ